MNIWEGGLTKKNKLISSKNCFKKFKDKKFNYFFQQWNFLIVINHNNTFSKWITLILKIKSRLENNLRSKLGRIYIILKQDWIWVYCSSNSQLHDSNKKFTNIVKFCLLSLKLFLHPWNHAHSKTKKRGKALKLQKSK